jgi:hypothetical protein
MYSVCAVKFAIIGSVVRLFGVVGVSKCCGLWWCGVYVIVFGGACRSVELWLLLSVVVCLLSVALWLGTEVICGRMFIR